MEVAAREFPVVAVVDVVARAAGVCTDESADVVPNDVVSVNALLSTKLVSLAPRRTVAESDSSHDVDIELENERELLIDGLLETLVTKADSMGVRLDKVSG